jgi:hypothetical protein
MLEAGISSGRNDDNETMLILRLTRGRCTSLHAPGEVCNTHHRSNGTDTACRLR